jgi:hypothetical protein
MGDIDKTKKILILEDMLLKKELLQYIVYLEEENHALN